MVWFNTKVQEGKKDENILGAVWRLEEPGSGGVAIGGGGGKGGLTWGGKKECFRGGEGVGGGGGGGRGVGGGGGERRCHIGGETRVFSAGGWLRMENGIKFQAK